MRKIIIQEFLTLDGVIQAGGGPEDTSGNFKYGGWAAPYLMDESGEAFMTKYRVMSDILLGRKTYDTFAKFWPDHEAMWPGCNDVTKYVVSGNAELELPWQNSQLITGDVVAEIKKLKESEGSNLQLQGSSNLVQTLLKNNLVDEMMFMTIPIVLGTGKRIFAEGTVPTAFKLLDGHFMDNGVVMTYYVRDGEVELGDASA
jgi:dihydrofolate reductase